jgi:hypothetical protein
MATHVNQSTQNLKSYLCALATLAILMLVLWPTQSTVSEWSREPRFQRALDSEGHTFVGFLTIIQVLLIAGALSLAKRLAPGTMKFTAWASLLTVDILIVAWLARLPLISAIAPFFLYRPLLSSMGWGSLVVFNFLMILLARDEVRRDRIPPKETGVVADILGDTATDVAAETHGHAIHDGAAHSSGHLIDLIP